MTPKERAAMQQALEALEEIHVGNMTPMAEENWNKAITTLEKALANTRSSIRSTSEYSEQAEQEPVGIYYGEAKGVGHIVRLDVELPVGTKLYSHPVRTKYLTDEEINEVLWRGGPFETVLDATRAVIAADREKNK